MLILQRYVFRQGMLASLMSLLVFLAVVMALFLAELLGDAAQGELPGGSVVLMLLLRLPEAVMLVGPLALLTGLLMTLGRFQEDSELVIMRSAGFSYGRLLQPVALLSILWTAGLLFISGWLSPQAIDRSAELLTDVARRAMVSSLHSGQFNRVNHGLTTIYAGSLDRRTEKLGNLFIQHLEDGQSQVLTARSGQVWLADESDGSYLLLEDGFQIEHAARPSGAPLREMRFGRNELRLPAPEDIRVAEESRQRLTELWPADSPAQRREQHWRLAPPLAGLLLGLIALPLSSRRPRQGRHGSVIAALVLYLVYSNIVHGGLIVMEQKNALSGPGLWPVHAALAMLALVLLLRHRRAW
ncbi:MAG TPA: LPS export ABC transporter permease LptF [Wenzhouxiangella sp.]|nr:LPS export ABC transporter permease LptF [Wenzhouxiangella sp.]